MGHVEHHLPTRRPLDITTLLFVGLTVPLILLHPRVLFRTLLGDIAEAPGYILSAAYALFALILIGRTVGRPRRVAVGLVLFAVATAIRYQVSGVRWTITGPLLMPYLAGAAAVVMVVRPSFAIACVWAIAAAISIDALVILFPSRLVVDGLDRETVYGASRYGSTMLFSGRATGFHQSPGELVFLASAALGLGLGLLGSRHRLLGIVLTASGALCAMATGNRSALLATAAIALYLAVASRDTQGKRRLTTRLVPIVALVAIVGAAFAYAPYREQLMSRLENKEVEQDSEVRMRGSKGVVDAIPSDAESAIVGMVASGPQSELAVYNGHGYIQPHNGLVFLLAGRGVLFLAVFSYWLIAAVRALWRPPSSGAIEVDVPRTAILAGMVGGMTVSMVETQLETASLLLLLGLGLGLYTREHAPAAPAPAHGRRLG